MNLPKVHKKLRKTSNQRTDEKRSEAGHEAQDSLVSAVIGNFHRSSCAEMDAPAYAIAIFFLTVIQWLYDIKNLIKNLITLFNYKNNEK